MYVICRINKNAQMIKNLLWTVFHKSCTVSLRETSLNIERFLKGLWEISPQTTEVAFIGYS